MNDVKPIYKTRFMVTVTGPERAAIWRVAEEEGRTIQEQARRLILEALRNRGALNDAAPKADRTNAQTQTGEWYGIV